MTVDVDTTGTTRQACCRRAWFALLPALTFFATFGSLPAPAPASAAGPRPISAVGDLDYPPVTYLEDSVPRGFDVDVLKALAQAMGRDLQLELMPWNLAQKRVQEGASDVLTGMSITEERRKSWDFATTTLTHAFSLFITGGEVAIHGVADLQGKRVGVKAGALPELFLKARPGVNLISIPSYKEGFDLLKQGGIDAVAADQWVGGYILNKYRIDGIVTVGEPFATLESGIAVAKGNTALLQEINSGLEKLRQGGAIDAIRRRWEPKQVVYLLKEEVTSIVVWATGATAFLLFGGMAGWIFTLKREARVRRKVELQLRASQERYRVLVEQAPEAIVVYDTDLGRFVDVNANAERLSGYSREVLLQSGLDRIYAPMQPGNVPLGASLEENIARVLAGESITIESLMRNSHGEDIPCELRAVRLPSASRRLIRGSITDISERKGAEQALRESEQRLTLALDAARTGIWEWRAKSGELIATRRAEEIFGLQEGQFGGTYEAFLRLVHPDDVDRVAAFNIGVLEGRSMGRSIEHRVVCADGELRWVESRGVLHRDAAGQPERVVGTVVDITQRKNAEDQIRRFNAELEQRVHLRTEQLESANRELEAFSYSVSHDLRAPLRSISGFGNLLLQNNYDQLDTEGRARLQRILTGSDRMGRLIDDLLNLAKISRQAISVSPVRLHALAAEIVAGLREAGAPRQVEVVIGEDLTVEADAGLMRVVLDNLLGNAWKFTGGLSEARIEFGSQLTEGRPTYYVRDNGAGFDMSYAGKLFAPFQRMHTQQQFEGTGIGLATVKRIIERHQGKIWIESAVGRGTTVFFTVDRPA